MDVREWLGEDNQLGIDIWTKKYQMDNETFDEWLDRVSGGNEKIRQLIIEKKFLFGGRILSNRGMQKRGRKVTYSNCYVIQPPEDNIESIFECAGKLARTFSYGGGCGIDMSKLAPRGATINNAAKETTGAVSFMELYNLTTSLIGQNGRRGALMLSLDCNHPDLEEFISVKNDLNKITKANISVRVDDEFMMAVLDDEEYEMKFVRDETGEIISKKVRAKDIFHKLCENNWNYAEPGILFWDEIEKHNLLRYDDEFKFAGVNPCAEEPLPAGGSCLLGSINLSEFVVNGTFDFDDFCETVSQAVIALNEVLDEGLELHPLFEQRASVRDWRQIGLGIFGLADMLIKMGIEYGSGDSLSLCDNIGIVMADAAIRTSAYLARLKGSYNKFKPEALDSNLYFINNTFAETKEAVKRYGLRNSQLLTIAPTGSLSTMLGVSGGIEPIFDTSYTRKTESLHGKDEYYKVYTPIVKKYMYETGMKEGYEGYLPSFFKTAKTIDPKKRVKMQAVWQEHIDASISSTVNLPESATVEEVEELYKYAWKNNLKGLTIFRENCARTGILTSNEEKKDEKDIVMNPELDKLIPKLNHIKPVTRKDLGGRLDGSTYVKQTACGKLYITINRDADGNLVEVFIDPGKSGGCVANAESLGRYASSMMRAGMSIESIIDATKGVKCAACTKAKGGNKDVDGLSCGDILARTIQEEYDRFNRCKVDSCSKCENKCELGMEEVPNKDTFRLENIAAMLNPENWVISSEEADKHRIKFDKNTCPECGVELANEGGCVTCKNCGYSKCD